MIENVLNAIISQGSPELKNIHIKLEIRSGGIVAK